MYIQKWVVFTTDLLYIIVIVSIVRCIYTLSTLTNPLSEMSIPESFKKSVVGNTPAKTSFLINTWCTIREWSFDFYWEARSKLAFSIFTLIYYIIYPNIPEAICFHRSE